MFAATKGVNYIKLLAFAAVQKRRREVGWDCFGLILVVKDGIYIQSYSSHSADTQTSVSCSNPV